RSSCHNSNIAADWKVGWKVRAPGQVDSRIPLTPSFLKLSAWLPGSQNAGKKQPALTETEIRHQTIYYETFADHSLRNGPARAWSCSRPRRKPACGPGGFRKIRSPDNWRGIRRSQSDHQPDFARGATRRKRRCRGRQAAQDLAACPRDGHRPG